MKKNVKLIATFQQVKCFALNRMDILQREGKYPVAVDVSPILGVEVSGVIESIGSDGNYFSVQPLRYVWLLTLF